MAYWDCIEQISIAEEDVLRASPRAISSTPNAADDWPVSVQLGLMFNLQDSEVTVEEGTLIQKHHQGKLYQAEVSIL